MSISDSTVIDSMGLSKTENKIILLITDHLPWDEDFEYEHLMMLQDKINMYLTFIENKQYEDVYGKKQVEGYIIKIAFKYDITENCKKFLRTANNYLATMKIVIEIDIDGKEESNKL